MADKKNLSWRDICTKYITQAIMDAFAAHSTMNKQALDSERVRNGLKDVLLGPAKLYEALRRQRLPWRGVLAQI